MLIRAYRVMGHLAADLDPLGLADRKVHRELKPETYGFTDADLDRPIFIDRVLGLETATHAADPAHHAPHLLPAHRRAVHAHHQPGAEGLDPGPHRGRGEGHPLHARRAGAPSSTS